MNNYQNMEEFINKIKLFALNKPNKNISKNFIYSLLISYGFVKKQKPLKNIKKVILGLYKSFQGVKNINIYEIPSSDFLFFQNGIISEKEIKLYIPFDANHLFDAAQKIFNFMANENIVHNSRVAYEIRNDDLVIGVKNYDDARKIIDFVKNDSFLSNNIIMVNPFIPSYNGIGMVVENGYSFNFVLCEILADLVYFLKKKDRLKELNISTLNAFINSNILNVKDLDKREIYVLLAKITKKEFQMEELINYFQNKTFNDGNNINNVDYNYFLEEAVRITEKYYENTAVLALKKYMLGDSTGFAMEEDARANLLKYVESNKVMILIKEYLDNKAIVYFNDDDAINKYVRSVVMKNIFNEKDDADNNLIDILKIAYRNTCYAYNKYQAEEALRKLLNENNLRYFTNRFNDRSNLLNLIKKYNIKRILANYVGEENQNNTEEIVAKFDKLIEGDYNNGKQFKSRS